MRFSLNRSRRSVAVAVAATLIPIAAFSVAAIPVANAASCTSITIIGVRGTGAAGGSGPLIHSGTVYTSGGLANVQTTASDINAGTTASVHYEGLAYPATFITYQDQLNLVAYWLSEADGVSALRTDIEYDTSHCPSSKIVLLGLSQGAQVVGDVIDKTTGTQLSTKAKARIYAVGLMGDPEFKHGESFNTGTMTAGKDGAWPRGASNLSTFASRIRDYCLKGDWMCQGQWTVAGYDVHLTYNTAAHDSAMAKWVLTKL